MNDSAPSMKETVQYLWPCIWTKNTRIGKTQVILAVLFILSSIALNLSVPIFLKEAINALAGHETLLNNPPLLIIITYALVWGASKVFVSLSQVVAYPVDVDGARRFCQQLH